MNLNDAAALLKGLAPQTVLEQGTHTAAVYEAFGARLLVVRDTDGRLQALYRQRDGRVELLKRVPKAMRPGLLHPRCFLALVMRHPGLRSCIACRQSVSQHTVVLATRRAS
jgi:hypothetical protein